MADTCNVKFKEVRFPTTKGDQYFAKCPPLSKVGNLVVKFVGNYKRDYEFSNYVYKAK